MEEKAKFPILGKPATYLLLTETQVKTTRLEHSSEAYSSIDSPFFPFLVLFSVQLKIVS